MLHARTLRVYRPFRQVAPLLVLALFLALIALLTLGQPRVKADASGNFFLPILFSPNSTAPLTLTADRLVQGNVTTSGVPINYTYMADGPGWISIRSFGSDEFDPCLIFNSPDGLALHIDDDGAGIGNAAFFSYHLPASGRYTLAIAGTKGATGTYRVMLHALQMADVADINGDCYIGTGDISVIVSNWGPTEVAVPAVRRADINLDGAIGQGDVDIVIARWGPVCQ